MKLSPRMLLARCRLQEAQAALEIVTTPTPAARARLEVRQAVTKCAAAEVDATGRAHTPRQW